MSTRENSPPVITPESFPTPALAICTTDPAQRQKVTGFAAEQANAAAAIAARLHKCWPATGAARRAALRAALDEAERWRYDLAVRVGDARSGIDSTSAPERFRVQIGDGSNYDRIGTVGRLRECPTWNADRRQFLGGRPTPASDVLAEYGEAATARFARQAPDADELHNMVRLPDGQQLPGVRLLRGAAAERAAAELVARIAARGVDASQIETGGELLYTVTASAQARHHLRAAVLALLAQLDPAATSDDAAARWATATYCLFHAPRMKKGSDATARVFAVATAAALLNRAPILPHDIDLQAYVLDQDVVVSRLTAAITAPERGADGWYRIRN